VLSVFVIIFGSLCVLLLCASGGLYGGIRVIGGNQKQAAISTAIAQSTQVAGYDFFDDFENNGRQWVSYQGGGVWGGSMEVKNDMYVWDVKTFYDLDQSYAYAFHRDIGRIQDFDMSVDAKLVAPKSSQICYAVGFRSDPDSRSVNGYGFYVCESMQKVLAGYYSENDQREFLPWTFSDAIHPGDWNTLRVSARGDHFVLSINNVIVDEFTDTTSKSGHVVLMIQIFDPTPGTVLFDNFGLQPR
jgi:hypothetical protein